jgi:hypothetical protein
MRRTDKSAGSGAGLGSPESPLPQPPQKLSAQWFLKPQKRQ